MLGINSKVQHVCIQRAVSDKDPPQYAQSPWFVLIHSDEMFLAAALFKSCPAIALNKKMFLTLNWRFAFTGEGLKNFH